MDGLKIMKDIFSANLNFNKNKNFSITFI